MRYETVIRVNGAMAKIYTDSKDEYDAVEEAIHIVNTHEDVNVVSTMCLAGINENKSYTSR